MNHQLSKNGVLSYVICCQVFLVLSLKIVSVIQQSTGYNIESYIILPVKYYPMIIKITLCNKMSANNNRHLQHARRYYLYWMHLMCSYTCTWDEFVFSICNALSGLYLQNGDNFIVFFLYIAIYIHVWNKTRRQYFEFLKLTVKTFKKKKCVLWIRNVMQSF